MIVPNKGQLTKIFKHIVKYSKWSSSSVSILIIKTNTNLIILILAVTREVYIVIEDLLKRIVEDGDPFVN